MKSPRAKTYHVLTDDGWKIALHRYPRRTKRSPVLLVHGLASNRHSLDFPREEISLAKYLWKKGWDVWLVELRGAGKSAKPSGLGWLKKGWGMDHYVLQDLPSAVKFIRERTGRGKIHWIGHSLGGMLVAPFIRVHSEGALKSVTVAGSPLSTGIRDGYFRWTFLLDPLLHIVPFMPYRVVHHLINATSEWIYGRRGQAMFVKGNIEKRTLKVGSRIALNDLSSEAMRQFHGWMRNERFVSSDKKVPYFIDFRKLTVPFLIITGSQDPFTPDRKMRHLYERIRSRRKEWLIFGEKFGHAADYGHLDLILGRHAPLEVYPAIARWLRENDS